MMSTDVKAIICQVRGNPNGIDVTQPMTLIELQVFFFPLTITMNICQSDAYEEVDWLYMAVWSTRFFHNVDRVSPIQQDTSWRNGNGKILIYWNN